MDPVHSPLTSARWLVLATVLLPRVALAQQQSPARDAAPSKTECVQAFEQAQRLRNASRYLEANREVLTCTNPRCGALLSEECSKIYNELQVATPSVVFAARDAAGHEVVGASVQVDASETALSLDGKPIAIDPGNHEFKFLADGFEPQVQSVVIRAGERFRPITGALEPLAHGTAPLAARPTPAKAADLTRRSRVPVGVYVLGGVAVVGVGGFVGFRLWGSHDFDDLSEHCKPDCSSSSVDSVRQKYLISTVSLAVGAASAVGAVTWYLVARPSAPETSARIQVWSSGDGVSARFSAPF